MNGAHNISKAEKLFNIRSKVQHIKLNIKNREISSQANLDGKEQMNVPT